jgi:hypothetical protein
MERDFILQRFDSTAAGKGEEAPAEASKLTVTDWQHVERLVRAALNTKKKHKKHGMPLNLQQQQEYHSGATFWSPQKIREANARKAVKQWDKHK